MARITCSKCGRTMDEAHFYTGTRYNLCKQCLTMHIDNFNPDTYLYILKIFDVPYIESAWTSIRDKAYAKNPNKMNGLSVIGKYLAQMKLNNFRKYSWADTERLQQEALLKSTQQQAQRRAQEEILKEQYERGQISEEQYRTLTSTVFQKENEGKIKPQIEVPHDNPFEDAVGRHNAFLEENYISQDDLPANNIQMSLQEKQQMAIKWGRTYKISDWIYQEQKYTEMMKSFDIHDADSKNTLIQSGLSPFYLIYATLL